MEKHNGIKFAIFGIILLAIIIGGFVLMMKSMPDSDKKTKKKEETKLVDIRKNKKKDYIYFKNVESLNDHLAIEYKDIVLNFDNNTLLEKEQNDETKELRKTFKQEDVEDAEYDGLVSAKYKIFEINEYENYLSLIIDYFSFDKETLGTYEKTLTYVFNKETGALYSEEDLLQLFGLAKEDVLNKIKEYVDAQSKLKEEQEIDVDKTMENIKSLNLYVDKIGRLSTSIIVKSDQKDYNDVIILN